MRRYDDALATAARRQEEHRRGLIYHCLGSSNFRLGTFPLPGQETKLVRAILGTEALRRAPADR
jgi:hypothetical protein